MVAGGRWGGGEVGRQRDGLGVWGYWMQLLHLEWMNRDFPGSPVVKTLPFNAEGVGLIPGQGAKIPHASWPKIKT